MCGRYTLRTPADVYEAVFQLALHHELRARYNIAPTQISPVIRPSQKGKGRESVLMRWGLIPSWAKDPKIGNRMINARVETAAEKPSFRAAIKRRRCLIPADGFYEWKREGKNKLPYFIHLKNDEPIAFAGLWESWNDPEAMKGSGGVETYTILTTTPRGKLREVHDRMPVILDPSHYDKWLDDSIEDASKLSAPLKGRSVKDIEIYPVSRVVNSPANDKPVCIEPVAD